MVSKQSKAAKMHSNTQKDYFFLAGTLMEEPKGPLNQGPRHLPNHLKVLLCGICLTPSVFHRIRPLWRQVLEAKSNHFSNNFHMDLCTPANLDFQRMSLTLYMFLIIADTVIWGHQPFISMTFSLAGRACVQETQSHPKTVSKCFLKPATDASLRTWKEHQKPTS